MPPQIIIPHSSLLFPPSRQKKSAVLQSAILQSAIRNRQSTIRNREHPPLNCQKRSTTPPVPLGCRLPPQSRTTGYPVHIYKKRDIKHAIRSPQSAIGYTPLNRQDERGCSSYRAQAGSLHHKLVKLC